MGYGLVGDAMIHQVERRASEAQVQLEDACRLFERVSESYGVRLAGAADGLGQALRGPASHGVDASPDPRPVARRRFGADAVEAAWRGGGEMTFEQAVAYAEHLAGLGS